MGSGRRRMTLKPWSWAAQPVAVGPGSLLCPNHQNNLVLTRCWSLGLLMRFWLKKGSSTRKKKKGKIPVLSSDWHVYTNALILNSRKFRVTGSRAHLPPGPTNAANDRAGSDHHILFVVLLLSRYIRPSPRCGRRRPALPAPCSGPAQEPALGNVMVNFVCQFGLMWWHFFFFFGQTQSKCCEVSFRCD